MDVRSTESELRELMIAGLDGDSGAYRTLLARLSAYLRSYFRGQLARIGHGPVEAEDLMQEVLMAMHTRRHTYERSQPFTPWVHGIARYKLLDYLRRSKASIRDLPLEHADAVIADDVAESVESGHDLEKLLTRVPPKMRTAIQYVKLDGLSVSEASARSGMSESAIKVSIHRGLKALALMIRKES